MGRTEDCGDECRETLRAVERYLDGELDVEVRARIEAHLSDCSPCMRRASFRRHLKVLIAERCSEHEAPPELAARIQELIRGLDETSGTGR